MCDVVILMMCAIYWVLQYVSIDFVNVYWQKVFTISFSKSLENMLNITIQVNAYGQIFLNLQWYKMVHLKMRIIVSIIYA